MAAQSKSTRITLPGYGIALNHGAEKYETRDKAFPNALLGEGYSGPLLTVREYTMMELMNRITDKPGWETKAFDDSITKKWRSEALATYDVAISEKMVDWCIAEVQYKAELFQECNYVEAVDGIFKSDTMVPEDLRQPLMQAVQPLEDVPEKVKDWHPGSEEQVLDLVHPSLFPLVYGQSRILPDSTVDIADCLQRCGDGETVPIPAYRDLTDPRAQHGYLRYTAAKNPKAWSEKFQWLPSEFTIPPNSEDVKITSYINNLHPRRHQKLYSVISQLVAKTLPLWNATLTPLQDYYGMPPRIEMQGNGYEERETPEPDSSEEDGDPDAAREAYEESRIIAQPEPGNFEPPEKRMEDKDPGSVKGPRCCKGPLDLRKEYGKLQIIVKLANTYLTPEKPKYEGGSWHVEGQLNENICATALYYYDSDNISESLLAFRSKVDDGMDLNYEQDDHRAVETIFGFQNQESSIQKIGKVVTKSGRLLTFPNVFQHRVEPFHLEDPSKPGHRKILALFLVDPHKPIISTANIPCQQKHWWEELVQDIGPLGAMPKEMSEHILGMVDDFPISLEKAKELRLELMEERKQFVQGQTENFESNTFSLCEH